MTKNGSPYLVSIALTLTSLCGLQAANPTPVAYYSFSQAAEEGKLANEAVPDGPGASPQSEPQGPGPLFVGESDGFYRFDGMDYIVLPDTLAGKDRFTVSLWFRTASDGTTMNLLGANRGYGLTVFHEKEIQGKLRWGQYTDKWRGPLLSDEAPEPGVWHHVVITNDGSQVRMYLDGKLQQNSFPTKGAISPAAKNPEIVGAYTPQHANKWIGDMKDLCVFDRSLDADEVTRLYEARADALKATAPLEVAKIDAADAPQPWKTPDGYDYQTLVEAYTDTLLEKGRDQYGPEHSPLIAGALNRTLYRPGSFPGIKGIRNGDRITTGANPLTDENLYQILYALSESSGNPRYADESDEILTYFFNTAQSPTTGLLAWGEHMGWDFKTESPLRDTHEFARPWILWDVSYRLAPEQSLAFARGLWENQIHDQNSGTFSRHASWTKRDTRPDHDFPRHGGFYIYAWSYAYGQSQDPIFIEAITTLVNHYKRGQSSQSGAIPSDSSTNKRKTWPHSSLSLAIDLTSGSQYMPDDLKAQMRALAASIDASFLSMAHDSGEEGEFFITQADVNSLEVINTDENRGFARHWVTGYGDMTSAQVANICYLRYRQLPPGETKDSYKQLILATADRYLGSNADFSQTLYPGAMGDVIWCLLNAYEITQNKIYLERAEFFAKQSVNTFFPDSSPLPLASSSSDQYESITRADTLMMALLRLSSLEQGKQPPNLVYTDR